MASDRSISGSTATLSSIDYSNDYSSSSTSADTSDSFTSSEFSQSEEDRQDNELPPQDTRTRWEVGELSPGSYCTYRYYPLEREQRGGEWNPKASKGIVLPRGRVDSQWNIDSFSGNPKRFIQKIDTAVNLCRERREQFILLEVLPHLEELWGKCSESNKDIYKQLAMLSHCVSSGQVVQHSLRLLLHLICRDNFEKGHATLLKLEEIMRLSIFTPQGVFRRDKQSERTLELLVYSRILLLLLRSVVLQEELLVVDLENDWKKVVEELRRHQKQVKSRKKDTLRYSMELIHAVLLTSFLIESRETSPKAERMKKFLEECQEFCGNPNKESKGLTILQTLREKKKVLEWDELHFILYHLHGKVHSERPTPQMETERRAMLLVGLIIENYLNADGGEDWRFCLAASQLLVEIVKNNVTKELRQEAGFRLIYLLRDKKLQKKPECRAIVEQWSSQLLFSPDSEIRKIMIHFLSYNQREAEALPVERHREHLSSIYGTQTLEINGSIISQNHNCVIIRGMFQQRKVVVKMLNVMKNHLLAEDPEFEARRRLINEAHNLRRLSVSNHPNFPVLLGFDTKSMPYHIITAFEYWGNFRKFLQLRRDMESRTQPVHLPKMLDGVVCALLHLEKMGLVHRCVNAENILVGDNFVCKLSGLHFLWRLSLEPTRQDLKYDDYCTPETPQYAATFTDMDLPVRWQAPESLIDHHFSTASEAYGFGVLVYEVLTYGCTPYRNVLKDEEVFNRVLNGEIVQKEDCFEDCEYMLIKQCCQRQYNHRPNFRDIQDQLGDIINQQSDESKGRPDPPPLNVDISASKYPIETVGDKVYDHIPDIYEPPTLSSAEKSDDQQHGKYEDVLEDFVQRQHQGKTEIWERLSLQDIQHVKELRCLKNPHLVPIFDDELFHSFHRIISRPNCTYGILKDYVLRRKCKKEHIVMFLSQIASACHYLHNKHIVHGNLRAVWVYVESPEKVQVGRLGRSKSLSMSPYEVTSTSCVVKAARPVDATRWSSPEVNMDGYYTHASDVWAFGILAWELYQSFQHGENNPQFSIPYFWLDNDQILAHQRDSYPLQRPECCPDWVYILIHQCWAFTSEQRPPFLAIFDCLTSREPMNSWIMKHWLETHNKNEHPDLSITQGNDAFHVLDESCHPPEESIKRMCSQGFFSKHKYKYVERPINIGVDQTFGECGSPPYEEPVLTHSQACIAKVVARNEGVASAYACSVNGSMHSRDIENRIIDPFNKKPTTVSGPGHQNANTNETHRCAEVTEIGNHPGMTCNKNGAGKEAIGFKDKSNKQSRNVVPLPKARIVPPVQKAVSNVPSLSANNVSVHDHNFDIHVSYQSRKTKLHHEQEKAEEVVYEFITPSSGLKHNGNAILEEVRRQEEKAVKNASVEGDEKTKYASLTIHDEKPSGIPKEKGYQSPTDHRPNQADLTEKDETQSFQSRKAKLHHEQEKKEEVVYEFITPSSGLKHNGNAILEEVRRQEETAVKNASVEDDEKTKYASLTIHDEKPSGIPKEKGYQSPIDHRPNQADLTEKDETQSFQSRKAKLHHEQEKEEEEVVYEFITPSSGLKHNGSAILEEVRRQEETAVKNASVEDDEKTKYASLTIHDEKPSSIPKEKGYQSPIDHRPNQADLTEKDETQSFQSRKTKLRHEQEKKEEVVYEFITPSSGLKHNGNAILEEVRRQEEKAVKNASVEGDEKTKYASLTIHDEKPSSIPKEKGYQSPIEHRPNQADLTEINETQSYQSTKTKLQQEQEKKDDVIYHCIAHGSGLEHNKNVILEEVRKEEGKLVKNSSVVDAEKTKYPSLTLHDKELTGVPEKRENQRPREHRGYKKTHMNPPKKTKFQPRHDNDESGINDCITISFRDSQEEQVDANGNPEDEEEIAGLGETCNQKQNVSQEENVRMTNSHEDDRGASEEDTPVSHTLCSAKMKEEDHAAQNLQPAGEGTEWEFDHQSRPFRRKTTIWRKRKSSETKKKVTRKAKNLENKENVTPEYDSQKLVHEHVLTEVNEQHRAEEQNLSNEISPCLPQVARREWHTFALHTLFPEIEIDCTYDV